MQETCIKCKKVFDRNKENYCKSCYEYQFLKGHSLNVAAVLLKDVYNPNSPEVVTKLIELAKLIFDESKKQKFIEW